MEILDNKARLSELAAQETPQNKTTIIVTFFKNKKFMCLTEGFAGALQTEF